MVLAVLPEKPIYTDEEIWKPVIRWGVLVPNWSVSQHGRYMNMKTGKIRGDDPRIRNSGKGYKDCKASLKIPPNLFEHLGLIYPRGEIGVGIHRLVMETFMPLRLHYREFDFPDFVIEMFDIMSKTLTEAQMDYACSHYVVDHIDANPSNNHISNLRWCSSADNQAHTKARKMGLSVNGDGILLGNEQYYTMRGEVDSVRERTTPTTLEEYLNG